MSASLAAQPVAPREVSTTAQLAADVLAIAPDKGLALELLSAVLADEEDLGGSALHDPNCRIAYADMAEVVAIYEDAERLGLQCLPPIQDSLEAICFAPKKVPVNCRLRFLPGCLDNAQWHFCMAKIMATNAYSMCKFGTLDPVESNCTPGQFFDPPNLTPADCENGQSPPGIALTENIVTCYGDGRAGACECAYLNAMLEATINKARMMQGCTTLDCTQTQPAPGGGRD